MIKKLLLASLAVIATATSGLNAQGASAYSVTTTVSAVSQYMFRGQRLGGPSWQPSAELTAGDFTAGVWINAPFKDKLKDVSDPEIDLYGSYTYTLAKDLTLVPGFTFYNYPKAPNSAGFYENTIEPSLALNYTVNGVKLTPKFYYDFMLRGPTYEITAAYSVALKDLGTSLDFMAQGGTYLQRDVVDKTSPSVKAWGNYWQIGVATPFQITKESKLTLGFAYTEGTSAYTKQGTAPQSVNSLAVGRGVVTVAYTYAF
jgi:uncharacterized protein (TIGR02001 family)